MTTDTKPKSKRKWLIVSLSGLAIAAVLSVTLGPRLLVQQATQKPENVGTFVTHQVEQESIQQKMQQALVNSEPVNGGSIPIENQTQTLPNEQSAQQIEVQVDTGQSNSANQAVSRPENSQVNPTAVDQTQSNQQATTPRAQTEAQTYSSEQPSRPQENAQQVPQQRPAQTQQAQQFQVSLSESEISNMIYSGLSQGTAPEFRASIEGVSTRIANGQASITVALKPRYLPDQFLSKLPGVTRSTPTVYLGGDLSLRKEGNSVTPEIHRLSLGNFRVPMPFVQSAVKAQVQAYTQQMLKLPNGQQAYLDEVLLQNSAVTLKGHAQ